MGVLLASQAASSDGRGRLLADTAYDSIKRDIVRCTLEPGQQVTEEELADRYRVGRAAVRAALKRLYQEQLIEIMTRQRYMIAPITLKHVGELFDVRLLLEPPAARRAAGRVDGERLRTLDELCQAQYRVGDRESAATFLSVNTEFHVAVAEASGNSLQASMIRGLLDKVERVHHLGHLLHDRNQDAYHEHHDLLEALLAGDGDRAEQIMVDQIVAAKRFAIDAMVNSASLSTVNVSVR
jgi:DNA-binding GntR family transcriptional regulator